MASWVYLMQNERGGPIKIGVAKDVDRRNKTFDTANPYDVIVLGTYKVKNQRAAYNLEHELHERFAHLRVRDNGEWFWPGFELLLYMLFTGIKPNWHTLPKDLIKEFIRVNFYFEV